MITDLTKDEFLFMANNMEKFYNELQEIERRYCLANKIRTSLEPYDPTDCWLTDAHWFLKNEELSLISFEDKGSCGEYDYEERRIIIPKEYWFKEEIDSITFEELKKLRARLEDIEKMRSNISKDIYSLNREIQNIQNDKRNFKRLAVKYGNEEYSIENFTKEINDNESKIIALEDSRKEIQTEKESIERKIEELLSK